MCITGIPATGKTTLCKMLNYSGIQCASLNEVLKNTGIISDGIVDIDQLRRLELKYDVVESHYSHMIHCKYVIIIKDDENILRKRMEQRGYGNEKINENIEAQRSDIIYYERWTCFQKIIYLLLMPVGWILMNYMALLKN
ncbi:AAA family ATPase [Acidiplasma cupricumulans]|uniref:AAA family ATPase n=1 Tax=Acidiplasma cupricumulans TaxID=312540 RepID=UPI0015853EB8|nr:AAA family ATPase [Acidiplasma cupricumulans]